MRNHTSLYLLFVLILAGTRPASAQQDPKQTQYDELKKELSTVRLQLDSLRLSDAGQATTDDNGEALDRLSDRLDKRLQELENKIDAVSRASAPILFNPKTTAFFNFAGRGDNVTVFDLADPTKQVSNRFFLRGADVDFRNAVDPYAEAVLIMTMENEAGREFAVDVEEGYGLIKRLPILESAPMGLKLKIGKFRAPLGVDNKIHLHDLPWTTRPMAVSKYLGTEHGEFFEGGYGATGFDADFFLPSPTSGSTFEMNLDLVRGGDIGLGRMSDGSQPGLIGRLNWSADWNNEHLLIIGASAYHENGVNPVGLNVFDFTYKWAPSERRESHSIVAGGEVFSGKNSFQDTTGITVVNNPLGWFAYVQFQTSYWLYLGARYESAQEPMNDKLTSRSIALYASYYTTEFLRFRLGLEHRVSDIASQDGLNTLVFEANFVFGSHPTEPYWVNR